MTFSHYDITGVGTPIHEDFTSGALSSAQLILNSQNYYYTGNYTPTPPNQVFATSDDIFWLSWTKPDVGFSPVIRSNLVSGIWSDLNLTDLFSNGGRRYVKVPKSATPWPAPAFFGLVNRVFTKLQVLLPGESNAPDTASGKTGTPTPVNPSDLVTVTINAVDASFHIVNVSSDNIHLTSSDGSDIMPLDAALANGTLQQTLQVGTSGNRTFTATDTSNIAITAGTSSSLTVQ
jgi:hypothetical protein